LSAQKHKDSPSQEESSKRQERAERILDAATELVARWGYRKTTIDDIAKQAGVAKGTIYLHWKTREDLFQALIRHENLKVAEDIKQRIANDPEGATFHGMLKHSILATMKHPLWKAVMLRDTDMLGELVNKEMGDALSRERLADFKAYLDFLQSHGLMRTDLSTEELFLILSALSIGFLLVDQFMPDNFKFSDEKTAEMLADTLQRTFAPSTPAPVDGIQEASQAFNQYFERTVDIIKEQDQKEPGL
jgi:AcrR family transcriptional regulator